MWNRVVNNDYDSKNGFIIGLFALLAIFFILLIIETNKNKERFDKELVKQDSIEKVNFKNLSRNTIVIERSYLDGYSDTITIVNNPVDNNFRIVTRNGIYYFTDDYNMNYTPAIIRFKILSTSKEYKLNEK